MSLARVLIPAALLLSRPAAAASAGALAPSKIGASVAAILANKPGAAGPRRLRRGELKTFVFTEAEVNDYVAERLREESEKKKEREVTVRSGTLHLEDGRVIEAEAVARVGMGALKALGSGTDSPLVAAVKKSLSIDNSMKLKLLVSSAKGKIFVKVLEAKVKGVPLPESLVRQVLQAVGSHQHPPLDFDRLFPLPNGIQKVDVLPGRLTIQVRGV